MGFFDNGHAVKRVQYVSFIIRGSLWSFLKTLRLTSFRKISLDIRRELFIGDRTENHFRSMLGDLLDSD